MTKLELCPYHKCEPWTIGPGLRLPSEFKDVQDAIDANAIGYANVLMSYRLPDAMIWMSNHWYTTFCPECAKKNPTPTKHNTFGYGFTSQSSASASKSNWNKACLRRHAKIFNDALKGKTS